MAVSHFSSTIIYGAQPLESIGGRVRANWKVSRFYFYRVDIPATARPIIDRKEKKNVAC